MNLPDLRSLRKKIGDINGLITRTWTDDEITEKVNRSGVKANRYKPFEIARLNGLRKEAVSNEDSEAVAQIDIELAALEDGKLAYGTSLSKSQDPASRAPSQQDRLAMLNRANRKANTEDIRRAQLAEKKAEREAAAAVARGEQAPNAFARVKTRAKVHYDVNDTGPPVSRNYLGDHSGDDRSRAHTPVGDSRSNTPIQSGTPKRSGTPLLTVPGQKTEKGIPTFRRRMMDDEAIASMGIEIDI
jgi:RNA polymerase-associated protein RTF1